MPDMGCLHCRAEWLLFSGETRHYPEIMVPCGTQCFVCNGKYEKYILPMLYEGAVEFLDSSYFNDQLVFEMTLESVDGLIDILWVSKDWREIYF